jgi:TolB-like protein/DNA-binding winged helix-turn-helix (wHTH) protein
VTGQVYQFGEFHLDCGRFELSRDGRPIALERKPFELLMLLTESKGELVTRTEIAERLWGRDVFVDTEHGINTAMRKIRQALRDDPEEPRYVQTVMGRGYRLVAPVEPIGGVEGAGAGVDGEVAEIHAAESMRVARERAAPEGMGRDVRRRWLVWSIPVLALAMVGAGLAVRFWMHRRAGGEVRIRSLAVLPLDNLSGDPGQEYLADGMTDELTTMLAKNSTLRITSRTTAMRYKGVDARPRLPEIARELGVDGILEGSITRTGSQTGTRTGGQVHMTLQLIQAATDTHLWAESYDRSVNDAVMLPREAAQAVAKRLNSAVAQSAVPRYVSPEAHDAYLRGRYTWVAGSNEEAGKYFKKATELQPDYALGWAGLSWYYGVAGLFDSNMNVKTAYAQSKAAANKAVALDDSVAEAHLALGATIFLGDWDFPRANQEITRALELNPGLAEAYYFHSIMLIALNRDQEAIEAAKKSVELDPFARPFVLASAYCDTRQYEAAMKEARMRLDAYSQEASLHDVMGQAYRRKGMWKEAVQEWEKVDLLSGNKEEAAKLRSWFEKGGYRGMVLRQISDLKKKAAKQYVSPMNFALFYGELGEREETLSFLEEAYRQHTPLLLWIQTDPAYDFLHGEERYRTLVREIGLPPMY